MLGRLIAQGLQLFGMYPDRMITADQLIRSFWLNILGLIVALASLSVFAIGLFDWLAGQLGSPPSALMIVGGGGVLLAAVLVAFAKLSATPKHYPPEESLDLTGRPANQPPRETLVSMEDLAFSFIAGFLDQQQRNNRSNKRSQGSRPSSDDVARPFEQRKSN